MKIHMVKLGGSRITFKGYGKKINFDALEDLSKQISTWWMEKDEDDSLIIVHGAGDFGHVRAKKVGIRGGDRKGGKWINTVEDKINISLIHREVRELNLNVLKTLSNWNLPVYSFPPFPVCEWQGKPKPFRRLNIKNLKIIKAVNNGIIPLSFGDVIYDPTLNYSVVSGDHIILAASKEAIEKGFNLKIIFVMNEKGVRTLEGKYVKILTVKDAEKLLKELMAYGEELSSVEDVTGGIYLKLRIGIALGKMGVEVVYTDGLNDNLYKELRGTGGNATHILGEVR